MHVSDDWPNEPDGALVPLDRPHGPDAMDVLARRAVLRGVRGRRELHVTDGACPHNGGPLAEGLVRDGVVTCPWHWYSYMRSPNGPQGALVPLDRPPGQTQWTFAHAGRSYAVFSVGDALYVTDGACPHNGGPLAEGLVRDGVVTCPWHWYSYELATGRCRTAAGYELQRYPVVLVGGQPHASLPAPGPPGAGRRSCGRTPARAAPRAGLGRDWCVVVYWGASCRSWDR